MPHRHPTPAEIRFAIGEELYKVGRKKHADGEFYLGATEMIAVERAVQDGIRRACAEHDRKLAEEKNNDGC